MDYNHPKPLIQRFLQCVKSHALYTVCSSCKWLSWLICNPITWFNRCINSIHKLLAEALVNIILKTNYRDVSKNGKIVGFSWSQCVIAVRWHNGVPLLPCGAVFIVWNKKCSAILNGDGCTMTQWKTTTLAKNKNNKTNERKIDIRDFFRSQKCELHIKVWSSGTPNPSESHSPD